MVAKARFMSLQAHNAHGVDPRHMHAPYKAIEPRAERNIVRSSQENLLMICSFVYTLIVINIIMIANRPPPPTTSSGPLLSGCVKLGVTPGGGVPAGY